MTNRERTRRLALSPGLLVGAPRSGTTWLQRLLLDHPGCCGGQETHWLVQLDQLLGEARRKFEMPRPHGVLCHLRESDLLDTLRETWIRVVTEVVESAPEATRLVEKTPDHAVHLEFADRLLPEARVIHLLRDPEAVVASLLAAARAPWGRPWAPRTVEAAARRWVDCVDAACRYGERLGNTRYLEIRHADLARDPARPLARAFEFLGIDAMETEIASAIETNRRSDERTGSGTAVVLHGEGAGRILEEPPGFFGDANPRRLSRGERRRCHRITGSLAHRLDLSPEAAR